MTTSNIKHQILAHLETLSGEQVKAVLSMWLSGTSDDLQDLEHLLINQSTSTPPKSWEYGEIDAELNFQTLTEDQMVQQSQSALEAYRRTASVVTHDRVREWVNSLGTDMERPCPR